MNPLADLKRLQASVRRRRIGGLLAQGLPCLAAIGWSVDRLSGGAIAVAVLALAIAAFAVLGWRRVRDVDHRWMILHLDLADAALQDSSDLLFAAETTLSPLQRLQRERVARALSQRRNDLREPWPWRRIGLLLIAAIAIGLAVRVVTRPLGAGPEPTPPARPGDAVPATPVQALRASLMVTPPAYTGVAARRLDAIEGEVEEGSELAWQLDFAVPPQAVRLRFIDADVLPLLGVDGGWRGARRIAASTLYRIEFDGAPPLRERPAYRLDVKPDLAPRIVVARPERTLTVLDAATARWPLVFDADDDYGLGQAQLVLTLAQGSGEQIEVSERRVVLRGEGDTRRQHFEHRVDLAALGFAQGDDLIARLEVRDRREPEPNTSRSASFILRWPPPRGAEGTGVEGLVQQAMPAYFRSQRQIIIDTEALIAEWPKLSADDAMVRSDTIGADQRLLRLKCGQFLGEESEGAEGADAHHDDVQGGSDAQSLMAGAGHLHDLPEAATLLDPGTRSLLRTALDAMWQAETELRTGKPVAALPHEIRALEYIKRAQQADRIYLARVGLELPELDPSRRLTGERPRAGLRVDPLSARTPRGVAVDAWHALQRDAALPLDALAAWVDDERATIEDPLALLAEIDDLGRDPACADCRQRLARQLWPRLTPPAAAPVLRPEPDTVERAYLDALAPVEPVR
jgi:hypothetical protein